MDCGSLRGLVAARAMARLAGGDLVLAGPQPRVLRLFFLTQMVSHWAVFATVDEAAVSGWGALRSEDARQTGEPPSAAYSPS
jgi:anti-anti-sigma regulatory factor